jgi:chromosome segregation ATPase
MQRKIKKANEAINSYNDAIGRQSNTMDETHEKVAALTDIIQKMNDAGQDATQYQQELNKLTSPEQMFKDRLETLQHDVAMTGDKNVANKKYLQGLIDLQKKFQSSLTMQTKRWLEETVFQMQTDVTINATVRSDDDLTRLTRDVVKKISTTESLRGSSYVFM